ncbi:hypothetical protein ACJJTC_000065 [Scirpophaga incertulas]
MSQTLPPKGNTTFTVVYLGRHEGPVSASLYIHTSIGVFKYQVSAEGVASEWDVWPLLGLRVPLNATYEPLLTLYNPTARTVQVQEVYSSGAWVSLELPGGGAAAARAAWRVPPGQRRAIVRLRVAPALAAAPAPASATASAPAGAGDAHSTAYVRVRGDGDALRLLVRVEAARAPAGAYLLPPLLRLRLAGSRDPPHTWEFTAGNSAPREIPWRPAVWGTRCGPRPPADAHAHAHAGPPPPPPAPRDRANGAAGAWAVGVSPRLGGSAAPAPALRLTLDFARLWAAAGAGGAPGAGGAWCYGWAGAGGAAVPFGVRLLPGTLTLHPPRIEVVMGDDESVREAEKGYDITVHNEFPVPVLLAALDFDEPLTDYFHLENLTPLGVGAGARGVVARLRLAGAARALPPRLSAALRVRSNASASAGAGAPALHVALHRRALRLHRPHPPHRPHRPADDTALGPIELGALNSLEQVTVEARLVNEGVRSACLAAPPEALAPHAPRAGPRAPRCVEAGQWRLVVLQVGAGAAWGRVRGAVRLRGERGATSVPLRARVLAGRVRAGPAGPRLAGPPVSACGGSLGAARLRPAARRPPLYFSRFTCRCEPACWRAECAPGPPGRASPARRSVRAVGLSVRPGCAQRPAARRPPLYFSRFLQC